MGRDGYILRLVRKVKMHLRRLLNVSNMLDSLIVVGNSAGKAEGMSTEINTAGKKVKDSLNQK